MAPSYKLTYFDIRARGEISRLVFAAAGVAFEDKRIQFADWPQMKAATPLGSLPVLEVDGKQFCQSLAIATFLAREFGLYGKTNMDGLIIDQIQQQREDMLVERTKVIFEKDEAKKAENKKKLEDEVVPKTLDFFNDIIKKSGSNGYAVGGKLSLADLVIYEGTQFLIEEKLPVLDKYPAIISLRKLVEAGDGLKNYLSARKQSNI